MKQYDVVVIGLGIMGSAAIWALAKAGVRVLGVDPGGPTHCNGSSHGATRIFRRAYWEGANYLPLLNLAHEGWNTLQSSSDKELVIPTGGIFIGPRNTGVVGGSLLTAVEGKVPHEHWDAAEIRRNLPQFQVADHMHAVYEPGAYAIAAEDARLHMLNQSVQQGATLWYGTAVEAINSSHSGVELKTRSGDIIEAGTAIVTAGPWVAQKLLPELASFLEPKRVPIYWFDPQPGHENQFGREAFPVFLYEYDDGSLLYGIPAGVSTERGVKIGFHNRQQLAGDVDDLAPPIDDSMKQTISTRIGTTFPGLGRQPTRGKWCFYTMSTDESFLLGASERLANVYFASACSGHGFKFATGIGNVLSAMAQRKTPLVDIRHFHHGRFR